MQIWFHRYRLNPGRPLSSVARPGPREGALLRVGDGFADLHPWPEFGDETLDEQLARLAKGELTPLLRGTLHLARLDREAREKGRSLFEGLTIPLSHWPGAEPPDGFDTVKLKSTARIPPDVRIRIDFNATLTSDEFVRIAEELPRERIDFIEDPVRYGPAEWRSLRAVTGLRLALDLSWTGEQPHSSFDVLVHKPARNPDWPDFEGEIVVTSYMDHPVGQLGAAFVAASHEVSDRCGLMTHVLYEPDEFVESIRTDGARILPPEGSGIGFDDLLEALPWKTLR